MKKSKSINSRKSFNKLISRQWKERSPVVDDADVFITYIYIYIYHCVYQNSITIPRAAIITTPLTRRPCTRLSPTRPFFCFSPSPIDILHKQILQEKKALAVSLLFSYKPMQNKYYFTMNTKFEINVIFIIKNRKKKTFVMTLILL